MELTELYLSERSAEWNEQVDEESLVAFGTAQIHAADIVIQLRLMLSDRDIAVGALHALYCRFQTLYLTEHQVDSAIVLDSYQDVWILAITSRDFSICISLSLPQSYILYVTSLLC